MSPGNVDLSPKMDGGVLKRILTPGQGIAKPNPGSTVKVHYVGTLENGDKFDASKDKFEFVIGRGQVIKGWDIGIATMTKGEKAVFTIRSDYAYGDAGSPPKIPSGATLIFEKDGSIVRTSIVEGTKGSNPNDTSEVTAHIVGTFEGREFYNRDVNFVIGEGSEIGLPEGVDRALRRFLLGEKSKIELRGSRFTYGANPPPEYNLPVNATVEFTIFLKHFEKVPPTWEMTSEQKMANAKAVKERGTYFFQQGKLKLAWNKYKRMEDILEYEKSVDPEQRKERDELLISAFLNLSLTASKLNEHLDCITYCDKVLELQPANVKALYRKATAKLAMSDVEDAIKIYENVTQLEPSNKAAAQQILVCKAKLREQNVKDKKRYKNMFANLNEEPKSENKCGESCEEKETSISPELQMQSDSPQETNVSAIGTPDERQEDLQMSRYTQLEMSPGNVDISPKMDGGVLKRILTPGQGIAKPNPGSTVKVHYVGTLENGDKFDASKDKFEFVIGRGQVIKGWDIGIATMTKGEKAVFTIRSDYAYGDAGSPPKIPSGATLIFEKDGSIVRTSIVEGTKGSNPNDTSEVTAHIVGTFEGREFYNRDVNFVIGEGSEIGLPEGVDRALRRFLLGEKSKIELRGSRFTYGANPPPEYNLPVNATVEFTIFLKHFEKVPPTWEMTSEQKMANAKAVKERGTYFFQQGKLKLAWNKYKRMEDILEYEKSVDPEQRKERDELLISAFLNLSLTASKLNEHLDCITYCDKVLELQPANVKALYRKATAKLAMSDVEDAIKIYENVTQLEPSNKAAAQQILVCKAKLREQNVKDKKRYKNMFANLNEEPKSENKCGESCEEKETSISPELQMQSDSPQETNVSAIGTPDERQEDLQMSRIRYDFNGMNLGSPVTNVYFNDYLMLKIIGCVYNLKDRNALELTSRHMRRLCLMRKRIGSSSHLKVVFQSLIPHITFELGSLAVLKPCLSLQTRIEQTENRSGRKFVPHEQPENMIQTFRNITDKFCMKSITRLSLGAESAREPLFFQENHQLIVTKDMLQLINDKLIFVNDVSFGSCGFDKLALQYLKSGSFTMNKRLTSLRFDGVWVDSNCDKSALMMFFSPNLRNLHYYNIGVEFIGHSIVEYLHKNKVILDEFSMNVFDVGVLNFFDVAFDANTSFMTSMGKLCKLFQICITAKNFFNAQTKADVVSQLTNVRFTITRCGQK